MCTTNTLVPIEARRGYWFPGDGITGDSESPDKAVGNQTWVLWNRSKCSQLLSHLFPPKTGSSSESLVVRGWPWSAALQGYTTTAVLCTTSILSTELHSQASLLVFFEKSHHDLRVGWFTKWSEEIRNINAKCFPVVLV